MPAVISYLSGTPTEGLQSTPRKPNFLLSFEVSTMEIGSDGQSSATT